MAALVIVLIFETASSLIRGHSRAKQIRNRDRSDDQYDGHDDQELDQGETVLPIICYVSSCVLVSNIFLTRTVTLKKEGGSL